MNRFTQTLLVVAFAGFASATSLAQAPALDAAKATTIATNYLKGLGGGAPHIVSVNLERSSIMNPTYSWVIRWSSAIGEGAQREIGMRVKMDGSVARLVEDLEARKQRALKRPTVR